MVGVSDQPFLGPGVDFSKTDPGVQFPPLPTRKQQRLTHTS